MLQNVILLLEREGGKRERERDRERQRDRDRDREGIMKMIVIILTNQRQNMRKENRKQLNDKDGRKRCIQKHYIHY